MFFLLASLVLSASDPAPAAAAEPVQASADAGKKEKKVCRKIARTSSRMSKRECKTEADWASDQGKNAGDLKTMGAR